MTLYGCLELVLGLQTLDPVSHQISNLPSLINARLFLAKGKPHLGLSKMKMIPSPVS